MLSPIVPFLAIWLMTTICCEGIAVKSQEKAQLFAEAEALVTHVNQRQSSWRAATNPRFAAMTFEEKKYLMGVKRPIPSGDKKKKMMGNILEEVVNSESIPEEFDARKHFPECAEVIATIQDQSACGSCWAVSVASVITDRICVASGGKLKLNISALDLLSCEPRSDGCYGGWEDAAFDFYVRSGLCTGSNYEHHQGCKPYPWASVPHPSQQSMHETPKCTQFCENSNYTMRYARDKHYGTDPVSLTDLDSSDLAKIQLEIMSSGPVTISFMVYEDFTHYASGVYQHLTGEALGGHAVRLIGWGTDPESKVPYWLIANSWSNDWGENGYFRIRRGSDECFIESWGINWAKPDLD